MAFITNERIDALVKRGEIEEALQQPIANPDPRTSGIGAFVRGRAGTAADTAKGAGTIALAGDAAYAGLTLGDFLYDYVRIDPEVVRGVEFARAADVDGILSFARFAETKADLSGASLDGLTSSLQGYVAEQVVAHHLVAQGHDVSFPDTPNNPGWDISVDGHQFQVKCLADAGGVLEHVERYPDIPVIVNAELADSVADHAGVYVDSELHHDAIRQATEDALDRGRDLADFEIPWISLAVSGAFNFGYMLANDTDFAAMLACIATDAVGRTAGGVAGKFAGAAAGSLLFGPAGIIVVGAAGTIAGSMAGRRVAARGRRLLVARQEAAVRKAVSTVAEAGLSAYPEKLSAWTRKADLVAQALDGRASNQRKVRDALARRMQDHQAYWKGKEAELQCFARGADDDLPDSLVTRLLTLVRRAGIHAHHVQAAFADLAKALDEYEYGCRAFRTGK